MRRDATRREIQRETERERERVRGSEGDHVCLWRCQGYICGCCGTLQLARCEFCSRTLDSVDGVEFAVLTPAAVVPEFQRCHRDAKRCCNAAVANVTPDSGQNCAGHCWLTTNTNTIRCAQVTHTHTHTQYVLKYLITNSNFALGGNASKLRQVEFTLGYFCWPETDHRVREIESTELDD